MRKTNQISKTWKLVRAIYISTIYAVYNHGFHAKKKKKKKKKHTENHFDGVASTRVASTCNRTKINHHWLNQLQTLHTLLTKRLWGSSETLGVAQGNFGLISLSHSLA